MPLARSSIQTGEHRSGAFRKIRGWRPSRNYWTGTSHWKMIVVIWVSQEKAHAFSGKKVDWRFGFERGAPIYVNHYYFYIRVGAGNSVCWFAMAYCPERLPVNNRINRN